MTFKSPEEQLRELLAQYPTMGGENPLEKPLAYKSPTVRRTPPKIREHPTAYSDEMARIQPGEEAVRHRYVFQNRLKIAGGWWKVDNLKKMIALRVTRANGGWKDYWSNVQQEAA